MICSPLYASEYTNEQLLMGLTRASKAKDDEAVADLGNRLDAQSHACAVRVGVMARMVGSGMPGTKDYATLSAEICNAPPSVLHYLLETMQTLD